MGGGAAPRGQIRQLVQVEVRHQEVDLIGQKRHGRSNMIGRGANVISLDEYRRCFTGLDGTNTRFLEARNTHIWA